MSQDAVVVSNLSKSFRLPGERMHTLKERALHPLRRRTFDELRALQDVSFSVERGEFFGIVGRNGSGKSTLLKCLAGIYRPDTGDVRMRGRLSTFIELGVGFNPDLAARDNVLINGIMLGLTPQEALRRFDDIIAFAELEDFVDLKLKNYSSGMHVRLAFSVMIQVDADVLLIDEVLAVGDASFQQKCFDVFNKLRDEGKTILFVTHDMGAVKRFCHRALLLEKGEVKLIGEPERVGSHYLEINFGRDRTGEGQAAEEAQAAGEEVEEHFGTQAARVLEVWVEDQAGARVPAVKQGESFTVKLRVGFDRLVERPIISFALENDRHNTLFATSSEDCDIELGPRSAGDEGVFGVTLDWPFQPGRIFITPWVLDGGIANVVDRRPRFASTVVTAVHDTGGLINIPHRGTYERVGSS